MEKNDDIKELMEFISKSNFVEFELEREGFKLKLVKDVARLHPPVNSGSATVHTVSAEVPVAAPSPSTAPTPAPAETAADVFQVVTPMVGTFYRSPSPTAPPYVQVGDVVKKGQVLCIVEAMKLMNEIESEVAGEVIDVPVSNGQPVEYGEVLFRIRTTAD
jgi:acetyl-CoA carboxylase biotin carboxyl carrier protein